MLFTWIALAVIPSPLLIFISSEAIAIIWALKGESPLALATSLALGQTIGFACLCLFGEHLAQRWSKIKAMKAKIDVERYQDHAPKLVAWASFIGIPPLNLSCLASSAVGANTRTLVPLIFVGRWARYWIVAALPNVFADYVDPSILPMWLQQL